MGDRDLTELVPWAVEGEDAEDVSRTVVSAMQVLERLGIEVAPTLDPRGALVEAPETRVAGRYELRSVLGEGGMGVVHEAYDPELRRTVALKMLKRPERISDEQLTTFATEAQLTAQLEHPNIVPVHDFGVTEDGRVFFVMKRVDGLSLQQVLMERRGGHQGRWSLPRLLNAFVRVCRAVAYAHSRGVLHRDVKPANIMLGAFGEVLLMDWGLARADLADGDPARSLGGSVSSLNDESSLSLLGSPGYLSPEQATTGARDLDERTDVWGLGAVLYSILSQRTPYAGQSSAALVDAVRHGPPRDVRELSPGIDDEVAEVCMRAMAHDRESRFASAAALADAVEAFLAGSRRAERAASLMRDARAQLAESARLREDAAAQREAAATMLAGIAPTAGEHQKRAGWLAEDTARELEAAAEVAQVRFVQSANAALQQVPGLPEADEALADHYRQYHEQAEASGDAVAAARLALQLQAHDRGAHASYLQGHGHLTLYTEPAGAAVRLLRFDLRARRLHETPVGEIGVTPLVDVALPFGSYVALVDGPGCAPVRLPVVLQRERAWTWSPPGADDVVPLRLPRASELGEDDVFVPGGWYGVGGDPQGAGALAPKRIWIEPLVMRRFPVTHAEYIEFLDDVAAREGHDAALAVAPRQTSTDGTPGELLYADFGGRFALSGQAPDAAVANIDWHSAHTYARWMAARTGQPWRLPSELEWEHVARGADGRCFPWGDRHDPSWCCTVESHADAPSPPAVDSFPVDTSPFGVRGLAGGVRDWCLETFDPAGPPTDEAGRLLIAEPDDGEAPHVTRGGAWSLPDWVGRATCRGYHPPIRLADLGMRLARSLR